MKNSTMNRREAAKYLSIILGSSIVGETTLLTGCKSRTRMNLNFTQKDIAFLDEVADTIIPPTEIPGAKAAQTSKLMTEIVDNIYVYRDQKVFHEGIEKLDILYYHTYKKHLIKLSPQQTH